jgi:hypothetical protein
MDAKILIDRLEANREVILGLVSRVSEEQGRWRPAPDKWSILEVVNHLVDEERDDFRARIEATLSDPKRDWAPIDPEGWVRDRRYQERALVPSVQNLLTEREQSLRWLRSLESPAWENAHTHPIFGSMMAGDLLTSWVAHDLLHTRQLARLHWQYLAMIAQPYSANYAGDAPA